MYHTSVQMATAEACNAEACIVAAGARIIDIIDVLAETDSRGVQRGGVKSQSIQPHAPGRRRRFYLAVLVGRPRSTLRYDISLLRNHASHVSGPAVPPYAGCSPLQRSTAAEPSCTRCKQCARPAMRMAIGRHCVRRRPHDLRILGCRLHFRCSFNSGSITDVATLRICARFGH